MIGDRTDKSIGEDGRDFTFYFGAASGSARKALQQLAEPNVMLSYATENNTPWDCEQLFIDSGGYSLMLDTGEYPPADDYIDYVADADPAYFALQDFPCDPDVLDEYGRSVFKDREFSVEDSASVLAQARDRETDEPHRNAGVDWRRGTAMNCYAIRTTPSARSLINPIERYLSPFYTTTPI